MGTNFDLHKTLSVKAIDLLAVESTVPLMSDRVACGFPSPAEDHVEQPLDLKRALIRNQLATFIVTAASRSLLERNIDIDDLMIVDRSMTPFDGRIVVAVFNGQFTAKIYRKVGERIWLEAANPDFDNIYPRPGDELLIWGVVLYSIRCQV